MSYCFRRLISPIVAIAAMVAILAMGMATTARADTEIWGSQTDNPPVSPADVLATGATSASFTGTVGQFGITLLGASANLTGGELFGATVEIQNTGSGPATLYLTMGANNYLAPSTPPSIVMLSHIGGTVPVADSGNLLTFQQYVNTSNVQNAITGPWTPGPQTPGITGGSFNNDASTTITSLTAPYSVTEYFAITLSAGSQLNFSASTTLTPVPEPSTMAIAGIGALGLIGYGLRRRKARGA